MLGGLFKLSTEEKPRWWRALTISGRDAGLGFSCPVCGFGYAHDAPDEIRHCGHIEQAPRDTHRLPTHRLGSGVGLPSNVIPVGDWESEG